MQEIDFRHDLLPLKNQLYRLALRITLDRMEAEDIVQDTLLRIWQRRAELSHVQSVEAFCITTCRNLALDRQARKEARNLPLDAATDEPADGTATPHDRLEHDESLRRIHRLIDGLPETQRTVIQLRDIEGHTYKDIAAILGITEDNVKVTLFRARKAIREQYKRIEDYGL